MSLIIVFALAIVLLCAAAAIVGLTRGPGVRTKREPEVRELGQIVEREREVLRPDFGQEPDARRSEAGTPESARLPAEN
jgi:hypothetical protein